MTCLLRKQSHLFVPTYERADFNLTILIHGFLSATHFQFTFPVSVMWGKLKFSIGFQQRAVSFQPQCLNGTNNMKESECTNHSEAEGRVLAMAEATFAIYTQRVSLLSDSSVLDDSAPHVFTKSDIMLIQSEMLGEFSKYRREAKTHTQKHCAYSESLFGFRDPPHSFVKHIFAFYNENQYHCVSIL